MKYVEKLNNFPKVTQLLSDRAVTFTQVVWLQNVCVGVRSLNQLDHKMSLSLITFKEKEVSKIRKCGCCLAKWVLK